MFSCIYQPTAAVPETAAGMTTQPAAGMTMQPAAGMTTEVRNRMNDVIDCVAGGAITTSTDDVMLDADLAAPDSDESNADTTSEPPTKRKKVLMP